MRPLPRLLRTASFRLASLYLLLFAASALVLGATVFLAARSELDRQMAARIEAETGYLRAEHARGGVARLVALVRERGRGATALDYLVQDGAGTHLAGEIPAQPHLAAGWSVIEVASAREDEGRPERVRALASDLGGGLLLVVGDDMGRAEEVQSSVARALAWSIGVATVLGIGGGALLSRAFLARVDAIARTAEAIIEGDLSRRVPVSGTGDDLDRLAGTLNRMLDRIAALMESLRMVSSDVAHDLRTPLSRLFQRLEGARLHAHSPAEFSAALEAASRETAGLLETFSALLRIAQVEAGSPRAGFAELDLSAVAEAVADAYQPDAEAGGRTLVAAVAPSVRGHGDRELLTQALANLVENALRHTPPGTSIALDLSAGTGGAGPVLSVRDDGWGIASEDRARVLRRFQRGERSRTTPGNGLGLSLVAAVAEIHGATLTLDDAAPGLDVRIRFPPCKAPLARQPA